MQYSCLVILLCFSSVAKADTSTPVFATPDSATTLRAQPIQSANAPDAQAMGFIYPVLRNVAETTGDVITVPLAGDLVINYVMDYPTHQTPMTAEGVSLVGVALPNLHALAMDNLTLKARNAVISGSAEGLYFLALDGEYENALLLDTELWQAITDEVGPVIMTAPAADRVFFVPQHDAQAVAIMQEMRDDVIATHHDGLSEQMFTWNNGTWIVVPE